MVPNRIAHMDPEPFAPAVSSQAFVLFPVAFLGGCTVEQLVWQQWVYQQAFEQARAVVRPSLPERDLLAVWN